MRFGGPLLCSFLLTFVFSIAHANEITPTDFAPYELQIGRIRFQLIAGDLTHYPADAWVTSHPSQTINTDKSVGGALWQIDRTPFQAFGKAMAAAGKPLSFGSVHPTPTGPGMRDLGVKRVYHSIDHQAFEQILFFTLDDLNHSNFPFSSDHRDQYAQLIEENQDILAQTKPLAEKGRITFLRDLISLARDATDSEKEIFEKIKPVYAKMNKLIIDYYPTIHVETGTRSILGILEAVDADAEIHSVTMPTIGDGFFAGMSLEDAIADVYISAFHHVIQKPQGKPITVQLIVYAGHRGVSEASYQALGGIFSKFATFTSTWEILETLGSRTEIKTVGIKGLNRFRREVLHLGDLPITTGPVVEDLQPQPVPAAVAEAKPKAKGLFGRLCERLLK